MKEEVYPDATFMVTAARNRNTVKITHVPTGQLYSVHPADQAVRPIKNWMKKFKKEE